MPNITLLLPNGKQEPYLVLPQTRGRSLYYAAADAYGIGQDQAWKLSLSCGDKKVNLRKLCSEYMGEGAVVTVTEKN